MSSRIWGTVYSKETDIASKRVREGVASGTQQSHSFVAGGSVRIVEAIDIGRAGFARTGVDNQDANARGQESSGFSETRDETLPGRTVNRTVDECSQSGKQGIDDTLARRSTGMIHRMVGLMSVLGS